jgi:DNA repair protein RadD
MQLRDYQLDAVNEIRTKWAAGEQNVLYVLPCRGGKTAIVANIILNNVGGTCAIAHRSELVGQMSLTLARNGVIHRIIGSDSVRKNCIKQHLSLFGKNYINQQSNVIVASVDTLCRITDDMSFITLWVTDEAHHVVTGNKWHNAIQKFPNANGLGVTATPIRADMKGLGKHANGVMHTMIVGPSMAELLARKYLAPYRIFAPKSDLDLSNVPLSANGDFSPIPLRTAVRGANKLVGNIVDHYKKLCPDALALVFCVDVAAASEQAAAFKAAGIPAEMLCGETPDHTRITIQQRHKRGDIKVICNVDLYGEGVDIPNLDVVIMARPTESFALFYQQFCRPLNPVPGKTAMIIDHVGNVHRHAADWINYIGNLNWTLDAPEKRSNSKKEKPLIPVTTCPECTAVYERDIGRACPFCGETTLPAERSGVQHVDGDLQELSMETLAALMGNVAAVSNGPNIPYGATPIIVASLHKKHQARLLALSALKTTMAQWASGMIDIPRAQRLFYITFGIDVLSAQALGRNDAIELNERIKNYARI